MRYSDKKTVSTKKNRIQSWKRVKDFAKIATIPALLFFSSCSVEESEKFSMAEVIPKIVVTQNEQALEYPVNIKFYVEGKGNGITLKISDEERLQGTQNGTPFSIDELVTGEMVQVYGNSEVDFSAGDSVVIRYLKSDQEVTSSKVVLPNAPQDFTVEVKEEYNVGDTVTLSWDNAISLGDDDYFLLQTSGEEGFIHDEEITSERKDEFHLTATSMRYVLKAHKLDKQSILALKLSTMRRGDIGPAFHQSGSIIGKSSSNILRLQLSGS